MTRLTIRSAPCPPPPENLDPELHAAFAELCGRLQAGGAEITDLDALVIARTAEAQASLERAKLEASKAPLVIESKANGLTINPVHRLVASAESNLRSWIRLLPKASGGRGIPLPHVPTPTPAGDAGAAAERAGEPSPNMIRLKKLIAEFQAGQASAGAAAGDGAPAAADAAAAGGGAAAGVGGCVDAAAAGVAE